MKLLRSSLGILVVILCCYGAVAQQKTDNFLQEKANFSTKLVKQGESPQDYAPIESTDELAQVWYSSGQMNLKGLMVRKNIDSTKRKPVLVYLHGGFALGEGDVYDCDTFTKAGFIVFCPAYRGENGNEGNFELMMGEVDDAKAAIKWVAKQPYADSNRIYVFGHSAGGGVAAMLALQKDVPVALCGSSGGLYDLDFYGWDDIIPYDAANPKEGWMRVLIAHLPSMQQPHYAYIGLEDRAISTQRTRLQKQSMGTKLVISFMPGNHFSSLQPSMRAFLKLIREYESVQ